MPATVGLKEGMEITAGQANGSIETTTQNGRATITAQTPSQSGLNFAEANELLKQIGDKMTKVRWG